MTEVRYKPEEWRELTEMLFRYNSLLVKKGVYEHLSIKPKNYEEFKAKISQFIRWHADATASRLQAKPRNEIKANIDDVMKELGPNHEKTIRNAYEQLV